MRLPALLNRRRRQHDALARLVSRSVRDGVGLRKQVWQIPPAAQTLDVLGDEVNAWVEAQMAAMRRPYGIDHVALGMACAPLKGPPIASASFGIFRPAEFYASGGTREAVAAFVTGLRERMQETDAREMRLAAALFSWGDLARATVFRSPDDPPHVLPLAKP